MVSICGAVTLYPIFPIPEVTWVVLNIWSCHTVPGPPSPGGSMGWSPFVELSHCTWPSLSRRKHWVVSICGAVTLYLIFPLPEVTWVVFNMWSCHTVPGTPSPGGSMGWSPFVELVEVLVELLLGLMKNGIYFHLKLFLLQIKN